MKTLTYLFSVTLCCFGLYVLETEGNMFNVYNVASRIQEISTFVSAIGDAGLKNNLTGSSQFTLFAPTNEAFNELPANVKNNKTLMKSIVMYHITKGMLTHKRILDDSTVDSLLQGAKLRLNKYGFQSFALPTICITGVNADYFDVHASNGIIYILEKVIYPFPKQNAYEVAARSTDFSTLSFLLVKDKLDALLKNAPHVTVFAPTNKAFQNVPSKTMSNLLSNQTALDNVLKFHVLQSTYYTAAIPRRSGKLVLTTESTKRVTFYTGEDGVLYVDEAKVLTSNITLTNGVLHIIDKVLIPH
uniref:FAS1 domain-containing protein n=1 Tax=Pinctada fucata TaxID=50426 RepID=A0A194ANY0_PINFU